MRSTTLRLRRLAPARLSCGAGLVLTCLALAGGGLPAVAPAQTPSLEMIVSAADPAVGRVLVEGPGSVGTGSGFILGRAGQGAELHFLTNHHVIRGASTILVGFHQDGAVFVYDAEIAAQSAEIDLAVLTLRPNAGGRDPSNRHRIKALPIRRQLARKGESVEAIGFPGTSDFLGTTLFDPDFFISTLTSGNVSKITHANWADPGSDTRFDIVQHTSAINPGNSGGPLLDRCAQVVGLNTAVATDSGEGDAANDTYWAIGAPEMIGFLDDHGIPFQLASSDCAGPGAEAGALAQAPAPAPLPPAPLPPATATRPAAPAESLPKMVFRLPTWAVAAMAFAAALVVIGGAVLAARSRPAPELASGPAPEPLILPGTGRPGATALTLVFGGDLRHGVDRDRLSRGLRIGRGPEADIRVDGAGMSRLHAGLRLEGRRLMLTDLGSTNGTLVDGRRLVPNRPVQITSRSRIVMGSEPVSLIPTEARG